MIACVHFCAASFLLFFACIFLLILNKSELKTPIYMLGCFLSISLFPAALMAFSGKNTAAFSSVFTAVIAVGFCFSIMMLASVLSRKKRPHKNTADLNGGGDDNV